MYIETHTQPNNIPDNSERIKSTLTLNDHRPFFNIKCLSIYRKYFTMYLTLEKYLNTNCRYPIKNC